MLEVKRNYFPRAVASHCFLFFCMLCALILLELWMSSLVNTFPLSRCWILFIFFSLAVDSFANGAFLMNPQCLRSHVTTFPSSSMFAREWLLAICVRSACHTKLIVSVVKCLPHILNNLLKRMHMKLAESTWICNLVFVIEDDTFVDSASSWRHVYLCYQLVFACTVHVLLDVTSWELLALYVERSDHSVLFFCLLDASTQRWAFHAMYVWPMAAGWNEAHVCQCTCFHRQCTERAGC